jgi:NCS2 family nucleobase:cation symporter-2
MLAEVEMNRRNMIILAVSLSVGLGLQAVPEALQHLPKDVTVLIASGLLPVAFLAVVMNMILPEEIGD